MRDKFNPIASRHSLSPERLKKVYPWEITPPPSPCPFTFQPKVCTAFCQPGYTISGNATVLVCGQGPDTSQGYTEFVPNTEDGAETICK